MQKGNGEEEGKCGSLVIDHCPGALDLAHGGNVGFAENDLHHLRLVLGRHNALVAQGIDGGSGVLQCELPSPQNLQGEMADRKQGGDFGFSGWFGGENGGDSCSCSCSCVFCFLFLFLLSLLTGE